MVERGVMLDFRVSQGRDDLIIVTCQECGTELVFADGARVEDIGNAIVAHESNADESGCRVQKLALNAAYGKVGGIAPMVEMDAVSAYPTDMIPRVTVRDGADAMLLVMAMRTHMLARISELENLAARPGANQFALSNQMIDETRYMTNLLSDLTTSVITSTTDTEEN